MISDDEFLERVVAGIHANTTTNADVTWNEVINDRQFDVVVRFKLGSLRYLVLVEVKNRTRKTGTSDMEAFVQKARDQNANKAVFVTAAGFQDGAVKIAKRHGVDLFTVAFDQAGSLLLANPELISVRDGRATRVGNADLHVTIGEPHIINNIERIALIYADGTVWDVPSEQSQMAYCCAKTRLSDGRTLQDVLQVVDRAHPERDQSQSMRIPLEPHGPVVPPDRFFVPAGVVTAIDLTVVGRQARPLSGSTLIDPSCFSAPVVYTNVLTGESSWFGLSQLPLGGKRVSIGRFYFLYHPLRYYYSDAIKRHLVRWILVESFQNGQLIAATLMQDVKFSPFYIPVTDKKILNRLQGRLDDYRRQSAATEP